MPSPLDGPLIVLTLLVTHTAAFGLGWLKGITALKRRWYGEEPATSAAQPPPTPPEAGSAVATLQDVIGTLRAIAGGYDTDGMWRFEAEMILAELSRLRAAVGERT